MTFGQICVGDSFTTREVIDPRAVKRCDDLIGGVPQEKGEEVEAGASLRSASASQMLLLGLISKLIGIDFPGRGSVAVGLTCRFLRPVPVEKEMRIEIEVMEKAESRALITVGINVHLKERLIVEGTATVIPPA